MNGIWSQVLTQMPQLHFQRPLWLWALLLVPLIGIGFATMMIGMVILLPLAGHATWHAYRDLVR